MQLFFFHFTIYFILVTSHGFISASRKVKRNIEEIDDVNDNAKEEGLGISLEIEVKNVTTCSRRANSHVHEIRKASHNQFPFVVALMSSRNEYVCAGSIVSNGLILTSADCVKLANYALINTTYAKRDEFSVILHVLKSENFPTNTKNVALLYTKKLNNSIVSKIAISNLTRAEDIVDVEAIGFGLNSEVANLRELQYVGLEVEHYDQKPSAYINCIDTSVPSCFRDKGGPIIVNNELVGVVTYGADECTAEITSKYLVNKHMLDFIDAFVFKAWLNERIAKNNEKENSQIDSKKSRVRESVRMTGGAIVLKTSLPAFSVSLIFNILYF